MSTHSGARYFFAAAVMALMVASCGGGGSVAVGGGGPTPVSYRVLDLTTGGVTTVTGISLADPQYTSTKVVFRQIPAGTLTRGSAAGSLGSQADEQPATAVGMTSFWIAVFELTQGQWASLTGDPANQPWRQVGPPEITGSTAGGFNYPVFGLTENDLAATVSTWNTAHPASTIAIPTADQWEYACRGPTTTLFFWGDSLAAATAGSFAVVRETTRGATAPQAVGGNRFSNGFGLWDMSGNVREWVTTSGLPELRGGGWSDNLLRCRSANRIKSVDQAFHHALSGARLVLTAP